eukprot:gene8169-32321_t
MVQLNVTTQAEDDTQYLDLAPEPPSAPGDDAQSSYLEMAAADDAPADEMSYLQMEPAEAEDDAGPEASYLEMTPDAVIEEGDAKQKLDVSPPGTFVTRVSQSQPGHFALSVVQEGKHFDHMLILPSYAGNDSGAPGNTRYRLGTYSRLLFNTVPKLVAYYIGHPYINTSRLKGEVVPEEQEGGYMMVDPENDDDLDDYE